MQYRRVYIYREKNVHLSRKECTFIAKRCTINVFCNKCIKVFKKRFVLFFRIKSETIILFFFSIVVFVFLKEFVIHSIYFKNKAWFFHQIFVVFWRSTFNKVCLKKSCIAWSKLKCRWIFVKIFEKKFSNEINIMINLFID